MKARMGMTFKKHLRWPTFLVGFLVLYLIPIFSFATYVLSASLKKEPDLSPKHQELLANLKAGYFSKIEAILPAPEYTYHHTNCLSPHPDVENYLEYSLQDAWTLRIGVNKDCWLVSYDLVYD